MLKQNINLNPCLQEEKLILCLNNTQNPHLCFVGTTAELSAVASASISRFFHPTSVLIHSIFSCTFSVQTTTTLSNPPSLNSFCSVSHHVTLSQSLISLATTSISILSSLVIRTSPSPTHCRAASALRSTPPP